MGDGSLTLLPTPGHTAGSVSLLIRRAHRPQLLLAGCGRVSEGLAAIVEWPLTEAGEELGIPAPVDAAGAAIGAGLVLEPLTRPLGEAARLCEIVGVGIGLLTGCLPLALASAKLLAESEIHQQMARGIVEAGKLVFRDGSLLRAEPGDRSATAETSSEFTAAIILTVVN